MLIQHGQAEIVQQLFVDLGAGVMGGEPGLWPIYATSEAESPDNLVTVYDTQGTEDGVDFTGTRHDHYGIQVRVRAKTPKVGMSKALALRHLMSVTVYQKTVTVDAIQYTLTGFSRVGQVIALGPEQTSRRFLFTVNALVSVTPSTN